MTVKKPQTITFTGPDDRNNPLELVGFMRRHPEVEIGVLVSARKQESPRYPTPHWQLLLLGYLPAQMRARFSVHLQGRWLTDLLAGGDEFADNCPLAMLAERIQFNFHGNKPVMDNVDKFLARLTKAPFVGKQFIFQCDGAYGEHMLDAAYAESAEYGLNMVPFFDASGGAGRVPTSWPRAEYVESPGCEGMKETLCLHGYAGGLGPDNIIEQLPLIAAAAGEAPYWIDMETKVCVPERGLNLNACNRVVDLVRDWNFG